MKTYTAWIVLISTVVLIIGGMIWYSVQPGQYDTFASCIKNSGTQFFGASWCPHCQEQKALFGKSAKHLPYIECSTPDQRGQTQACKDVGIESYPTWISKSGEKRTGLLPLSELSSFTGCPFSKDSQ